MQWPHSKSCSVLSEQFLEKFLKFVSLHTHVLFNLTIRTLPMDGGLWASWFASIVVHVLMVVSYPLEMLYISSFFLVRYLTN